MLGCIGHAQLPPMWTHSWVWGAGCQSLDHAQATTAAAIESQYSMQACKPCIEQRMKLPPPIFCVRSHMLTLWRAEWCTCVRQPAVGALSHQACMEHKVSACTWLARQAETDKQDLPFLIHIMYLCSGGLRAHTSLGCMCTTHWGSWLLLRLLLLPQKGCCNARQ